MLQQQATRTRDTKTKKKFIDAGLGHSLAVLENGHLVAFGMARNFQLGTDFIKEKERRNGKTEAMLGEPQDEHYPKRLLALEKEGDSIVTMAAGSSHSLAVTQKGHVYSWGSGAFGKLGHGDEQNVRIPKAVEFKRKRIARVACGSDHSAAISEGGEVLTWGAGSYGNLGHGDNANVSSPKIVEALLGKACISVACGSKHTIALTAAGSVYTWGYGGGGRLGSGDTRGMFRPKLVNDLKDQACLMIAAGESHSMAITAEKAQCYTWGVGDYGKLGHGDTTPQLLPRHLEYFRNAQLIWCAGGTFHSAACAQPDVSGHTLYTWGGGTYGKLGQQDLMNSLTPRPVKNVAVYAFMFVQVECGTFHTIALTKNGDLFTFGYNGNGRLGLGAQNDPSKSRTVPAHIKNLEKVMSDRDDSGNYGSSGDAADAAYKKALTPKYIRYLCFGGFYSVALSDQGDVYTWGDGRYGATGHDLSRLDEREVSRPMRVLSLGGHRKPVIQLAAGVRHVLAVTSDGTIYSWGDGTLGRLGHGDQSKIEEPRIIATLKGHCQIIHAAAGEEHSAAVTSDGRLYTWGSGSFGKLGHGEPEDETTPRLVPLDAKKVVMVACAYAHSVALCAGYEVLAWGSGFKGKLGLSDDQNRLVPTEIRLLRRKMVKEICCGSFHTMALTQTGDLYTWGIGERGQLGHGDLENRNAPKAIQHLQGIEIGAISAGEAHSLAATKDRMRVYAWGAGHYGQLGVGGLDPRLAPTPIQDLEGQKVIHVACGANHSGAVALGASEEAGMAKVFTWGNGANSRLGTGRIDEQDLPLEVVELSSSSLTSVSRDDEPSRLLTPEMIRRLHGTDIDAATAQKILDESQTVAVRAAQVVDSGGGSGALATGSGEPSSGEQADSMTISTVMAVAMAGRAVRPSLDVLQQLVKSQTFNVAEVIENEQKQIEHLKAKLDEAVVINEAAEAACLEIENKVQLVLANHKMVHETLCRHNAYQHRELMPGIKFSGFPKGLYERMISVLYLEPANLSVMLKKVEESEATLGKSENDETNRLVAIICDRIYSNHYKARDEYYILSLIIHAMNEDMASVQEPRQILSSVNYVTKLMAAYTRRGPNIEALKDMLFKPLAAVLSRKSLDLEIDPARVYQASAQVLRHKIGEDLPEKLSSKEAWQFREVREIIQPRVKTLVEIVELFLTRVIACRNQLPYGIRVLAKIVYEMTQDRFPKATDEQKMAGVANFVFTTYLCPAIIQPEAFELCSASSRPTAAMKRNLLRIATSLKAVGCLRHFDDNAEPWMLELSAKIKVSTELMKQFYSNLADVPELDEQRRITVYMESTESRTPTRAFELNSLYLVHSVLYRHHSQVVSSSENPLTAILFELGNMPDQVSSEQNKQILLRLGLRTRGFQAQDNSDEKGGEIVNNALFELRKELLECLRLAPTITVRTGSTLQESLAELLRECKSESRFEAAGRAQKVIEQLEQQGVATSVKSGEAFLQATAEEISRRARRRVQLIKERQDLQKIVEFVQVHSAALSRKHVSYTEYFAAIREIRITNKNVYTTERMQKGEKKSKRRPDEMTVRKEEAARLRAIQERIKTVMEQHSTFKKIIEENQALDKYVKAHPNLTKTQMRDLFDKRPDFVKCFDASPEELMRIGRAPALRLMLEQSKDLKAALDQKEDVRKILESKPDLTRIELNELVHTNAALKDLYDSRPELKELLQQRARLFEEERKALEDQKADAFIAGPCVKVSALYLKKEGVLVTIALPESMVRHMRFEFSSVRPGTTNVLAQHQGRSVVAFELRLEDLLNMQAEGQFVLEQGKLKLNVDKTLLFLNEKMRF